MLVSQRLDLFHKGDITVVRAYNLNQLKLETDKESNLKYCHSFQVMRINYILKISKYRL